MHEVLIITHVHTNLSDGHATFQEIADAAGSSGIDGVITTDHNVFVKRVDGYYTSKDKQVLLLSGQEIHDQTLLPQKNHLLIFDPSMDFSSIAGNLTSLIKKVQSTHGLSFIAHPNDPELKIIGEPDISWEDWNIPITTGIELWNGFSEIKFRSRNMLQLLFFSFFPVYLAHRPLPETMRLWDKLLQTKPPCVAIGGADAHALPKKALWFRKVIFPYTYHFKSITNHVLLNEPLSSNFQSAKSQVYEAFRKGSLFIGYDLPHSTRGFRFYGQAKNLTAQIGETISVSEGITFQIYLPLAAECNLIWNGEIVKSWFGTQNCTFITKIPGVYRVEVYIQYLGRRRGWIFSNPIYAH